MFFFSPPFHLSATRGKKSQTWLDTEEGKQRTHCGDIKLNLCGCCCTSLSDLLTLCFVGAQLFKLSGCCRTGLRSRTSCRFGPLAPTCDASFSAVASSKTTEISLTALGATSQSTERSSKAGALISSGAYWSHLWTMLLLCCCFFVLKSNQWWNQQVVTVAILPSSQVSNILLFSI